MPKYKILKLKADKIINMGLIAPITKDDYTITYKINLEHTSMYELVVDEQLVMDNCALFDQFKLYLDKDETEELREWLLNEFAIVDFSGIYKGISRASKKNVEKLITNGFLMKYQDKEVHMLPFDKSGNMSRKSRLSFINAERLVAMNERLNLGIDFSKIPVKLSKYYAYRGLYLSTAQRVEHGIIDITPETLIVIEDKVDKEYYEQNVYLEEGKEDDIDRSQITFKTSLVSKETIKVPFDGQGIVSPLYADAINESLHVQNVNSFQVRLPFAKGMLHNVDFHEFLREMDGRYRENETYYITDAFGIKRDVKLANIIMTKSMFKGFDWVKKACKEEKDPMEFYCDAIKKYQHTLYISGTDLAYGHSKVTHLSYQLINTLKLSEKQFESLIAKQLEYIHNPVKYLELCQGQYQVDDEEGSSKFDFPNWEKALMLNSDFASQAYIKQQLKNLQVALMTKLLTGKLVVKGQTRYLVRDLPFMLVNLIPDWENIDETKWLKNLKLFSYRFYLPQGKDDKNEMGLEYFTHCGFFRSPHLSRNEQGVLAPFMTQEGSKEQFRKEYDTVNKYLGHLTGVVMVGNQSLEPMALGGADFDGDLVQMIMDEDVVAAIKDGVYEENGSGYLDLKRKDSVPYVKIPNMYGKEETVPKLMPYSLINDTFSDKVGLISNAAIAIGQYEYGKKKGNPGTLTCSQCTILTGLEIDAAKNGVHPDLSAITDNDYIGKSNYLEFKDAFENFKKDKDYHFNNLEFEKDGEKYILGLKNNENKIEYTEEPGTYINRLPIVFMENLNPKLDMLTGGKKTYFTFDEEDFDEKKLQVFKEQCDKILSTYHFYLGLYDFVKRNNTDEKHKKNLEKALKIQYDAETYELIMSEQLPKIYGHISSKLKNKDDSKRIIDKMNQEKWHLMNTQQKKEFLKEIFQLENVNDDEWKIVLQPFNDGYKILWYIVQYITSNLAMDYTECKKKYVQIKGKPDVMHFSLSGQLDNVIRNSIKNKELGAKEKIYRISLETLQEMIQVVTISDEEKIKYLFKSTKDSVRSSKLFWECFEWEQLEKYIVKENTDA